MVRAFIRRIAIALALVITACSNTSDPRIIEAAESLVPPESEIFELSENTVGPAFEAGPYRVILRISDGGHGDRLVEVVAERARAQGWEPTYRREAVGGTELGFVRDDLRADVDVSTKEEVTTAAIQVQKADE